MTLHLGYIPASTTLYIPFHTFDSNGASITITGLAVTDIEIYKNGSVTQRSSDAGYALLDTDGIDFDGITGIHGISIDLADNTDAGFYSAGAFYWVVISAITVDTRTVNFVLATFYIGPVAANATQILGTAISTPATAGILDVNVKNIDNDAASASGTVTFPNATLASTTNITAGTIATVTNVTTVNGLAANVITATSIAADAITAAKVADGTIDAATFAADAITAAKIAADVSTELNAAVLAILGTPAGASMSADIAAIEAQTDDIGAAGAGLTALATQASVNTIDGIVDSILVDTAEIGVAGAGLTAIDLPNQTMDITGNITGNLSGSVGSVTGAVGSVTGAVGSVTGNVGGNVTGSVGSVVGAVGSVTASVTVGALAANVITAASLAADAANEIADALLDRADAVETGLTVRGVLRLMGAACAGIASGLATATAIYRNAVQDSKPRITATVDVDGNRSAITWDVT